ncbi:ABC transporter permease [Leifsonia poae]|uniref:ABC transporter permease n=1 Tax=Leifsonia poae TaxID=110933 RepID=UPI001CBDA3B3|nr:ABC transporter permease [Leifsonia poae]
MAVDLLSAPVAPPRVSARQARSVLVKGLQGLLTLLIVSLLIFLVTQAMPGDVAHVVLGTRATPQSLALLRDQLGLDRPIWQQYLSWLGGILHGDWGKSLVNGVPVSDLLGERIRNSVTLSAVSMLIMLPVSLVVGVYAAQHRDGLFDRIFLGGSIVVNATPEFVIGTVVVALLGTTVFHLLPRCRSFRPVTARWRIRMHSCCPC